jgi:DNA-binding CsgD family transcriptional regulator
MLHSWSLPGFGPVFAGVMDDDKAQAPFERLSPRMRDCLRLVYDRKTTKQIAVLLGLSQGTVDGYVAEAVRLLGARNRVDAAERLHGHENTPCNPAPQSPRVAPIDEIGGRPEGSSETPRRLPLPIRLQGATDNDLTVLQRIAWIFIIAFGLAIGFGAVASGLHVVSDLVRGVVR